MPRRGAPLLYLRQRREKVHAALYEKALETLGQPAEEFDYFICTVCGHTVELEAPETCEICGAKGNVFVRVH